MLRNVPPAQLVLRFDPPHLLQMVCPLSPLLPRFGLLPDPNGLAFLGLAGLCHTPDRIPPGWRVPITVHTLGSGKKGQLKNGQNVRYICALVIFGFWKYHAGSLAGETKEAVLTLVQNACTDKIGSV